MLLTDFKKYNGNFIIDTKKYNFLNKIFCHDTFNIILKFLGKQLKIGTFIDVLDLKTRSSSREVGIWRICVIVDINIKNNEILIKYPGWRTERNEWISIYSKGLQIVGINSLNKRYHYMFHETCSRIRPRDKDIEISHITILDGIDSVLSGRIIDIKENINHEKLYTIKVKNGKEYQRKIYYYKYDKDILPEDYLYINSSLFTPIDR